MVTVKHQSRRPKVGGGQNVQPGKRGLQVSGVRRTSQGICIDAKQEAGPARGSAGVGAYDLRDRGNHVCDILVAHAREDRQ